MAGSVCGLFEGTLYAVRELVPFSLASLRHLVHVSPKQHTIGAEATRQLNRPFVGPDVQLTAAVLPEDLDTEVSWDTRDCPRLSRSALSASSSSASGLSVMLSGASTPTSDMKSSFSQATPEKPKMFMGRLGSHPIVFEETSSNSDND
ncbi:hypothetical protein WJX74_009966 [Apatococcus lobatus]|uniref:Uncharacterized protein n=2 Tax=Apatococcus TaxID=904362 RepID=A0AAW1SPE5_9CHLO